MGNLNVIMIDFSFNEFFSNWTLFWGDLSLMVLTAIKEVAAVTSEQEADS